MFRTVHSRTFSSEHASAPQQRECYRALRTYGPTKYRVACSVIILRRKIKLAARNTSSTALTLAVTVLRVRFTARNGVLLLSEALNLVPFMNPPPWKLLATN